MRLLTYHLSQRENGIGSFLCFLVIVFDFHIDNMHRSIQFLPTAQQILYMCEFFFIARQTKIVYAPSQTLSKQRSSHVITTSETRRHSCQRSGADLMCRLRSNIGKSPLASQSRESFFIKSWNMVSYGVPNAQILGLSIDGPGRRTADPVPHDVTR